MKGIKTKPEVDSLRDQQLALLCQADRHHCIPKMARNHKSLDAMKSRLNNYLPPI